MFDVTTGETRQVAQHDAPVKAVRWVQSSGGGVLATGSWDKTIKVRPALPTVTHDCADVYSSIGTFALQIQF